MSAISVIAYFVLAYLAFKQHFRSRQVGWQVLWLTFGMLYSILAWLWWKWPAGAPWMQ